MIPPYKNRPFYIIALLFSLSSCATPYLDDIIHNKYFEYEKVSDPSAPYLGEWTSANAGGIYTMKIFPDGVVITCMKAMPQSNFGKMVQVDSGRAIMYERGSIERITSVHEGELITDLYGEPNKYHQGDTPDACRPFLGTSTD